jgi:beta-lactam-binding protein with PASTA domain
MALGKNKVLVIVVVVAVLLLCGCMAFAAIAINLFAWGGGDTIEIPDMVGMTVPEARDALSIRSEIMLVEDAEAEPGTVVAQSHEPGTKTHHDDIVRLEVAGPLMVPELVGAEIGDAQSELYAAGFDELTYEYDPAATEAAGTVLFVEPQAGSETWETAATLYIAGEDPYPEY